MPQREIKKSYQNITGKVISLKNRRAMSFESGLERDFLTLLDFDITVDAFEEQPVTIPVALPNGTSTIYTPDVLVTYRSDIDMAIGMVPMLCEVKYRDDLFSKWSYYKPRFKAARRYARNRGWIFRIITEREIKTPLLENVRFLSQYERYLGIDGQANQILSILKVAEECEIKFLINKCSMNKWDQAQYLPVLWRLICERRIGVNMSQKITMSSLIWNVE